MATKRITVLLKAKDRQAVQDIRARFGLRSQSEAVRFALRLLASSSGHEGILQELSVQGAQSTSQRPLSRVELAQQAKPKV